MRAIGIHAAVHVRRQHVVAVHDVAISNALERLGHGQRAGAAEAGAKHLGTCMNCGALRQQCDEDLDGEAGGQMKARGANGKRDGMPL